MFIAYSAGGRTANQVYHALYLYAAALEHDLSFKLVAFRSCEHFEIRNTERAVCCYSPASITACRWLSKFIRRMRPLFGLFRMGEIWAFNQADGALTPSLAATGGTLTLLNCWPYIDSALLRKHQEAVRRYIRPLSRYADRAAALIQAHRCPSCPVVAVHVRRTDYKDWLDGRYYYDLETFRRFMRQISELMNGQVSFIVCSDEDLTEADFDIPCARVTVSQEKEFMVDYCLLSQCDYSIGPPSTFRLTSSFLGNTPTYSIEQADASLPSMEAFHVGLLEG